MNRFLWILQIVLGIYFVAVGVTHFVLPEGLPDLIGWMYELTDQQHLFAGIAEILGGLGLILPGLTGIQPRLTVWAGIGLAVVMVFAAIWHAGRDEVSNIVQNIVLAGLVLFIAYGRWRLHPLPAKTGAASG